MCDEIDCFVVVVCFVDGGEEDWTWDGGGFLYLVEHQWSRLIAVTKRCCAWISYTWPLVICQWLEYSID